MKMHTMDVEALQRELKSLKEQSNRLAMDELDGLGEAPARYQQAFALNERLQSLQTIVEEAPPSHRPALQTLWRAVEHDLIFIIGEAEAAQAAASPINKPETNGNLVNQARQINDQAFKLACSMAVSSENAEELASQARILDARIKGMVPLPGYQAPEVQKLMGEAVQDLRFVLAGGRGPMSLRLHHFLQDSR